MSNKVKHKFLNLILAVVIIGLILITSCTAEKEKDKVSPMYNSRIIQVGESTTV